MANDVLRRASRERLDVLDGRSNDAVNGVVRVVSVVWCHNDIRELQQHVARKQGSDFIFPMSARSEDLGLVSQKPLLRKHVQTCGKDRWQQQRQFTTGTDPGPSPTRRR